MKNEDYNGFFTLKKDDNITNVKIVDSKNVEFLYHQFISDIYYFIRWKKAHSKLLLNDETLVDGKNLSIVCNDKIVLKYVWIGFIKFRFFYNPMKG